MEDFISDLQRVHWWLGVVVVGVAINIFAAHLPRWLGAGANTLFLRLQLWTVRDRDRFERDVLAVMESDIARTAFLARVLGGSFRCGILVIVALVNFYAALHLSSDVGRKYLFATNFLVVAAFVQHSRTRYVHGVIQAAAERLQQQECADP